MSTAREYVNAIAGLLAPVARTLVGDDKPSQHTERRIYAWFLGEDAFEAPSGHGRDAEQIKNRVATFVVRCSGRTNDEAEMLRAALITAAGKVCGGYSDKSIRVGRAVWYSRASNQDPHVVDQTLSLVVPFHLVTLPTGPGDATDAAFAFATINARAIEGSSFETEETIPP